MRIYVYIHVYIYVYMYSYIHVHGHLADTYHMYHTMFIEPCSAPRPI